MKKEFDDYLVKKYPKIFADRYSSPEKTCMCWGFDCGEGWLLILDKLCSVIQNHIDERLRLIEVYKSINEKGGSREFSSDGKRKKKVKIPHEIPQVVAVQIKQKFGSLRFYANGGDEVIDGAIRMAEAMSLNTCELCGSTKDIGMTSGFIQVLCKECVKKNKIKGWKKNK